MTQVEQGLRMPLNSTFSSQQGILVIKLCQSILAEKLLRHLETTELCTLKLKLGNYRPVRVPWVLEGSRALSQVPGTC